MTDHVELVGEFGQRTFEPIFAARPHQQHRLSVGEVNVGRQQRHSLHHRDQRNNLARPHRAIPLVHRNREFVEILAQHKRVKQPGGFQIDKQYSLRNRLTPVRPPLSS